MRSRWIIAAVFAIAPLTSSYAQQTHPDARQQIEQLAKTFNERYNKQDATALASMFTKDAVRVSPGVGAVSIGPQAIEELFKTQFTLGLSRIDRVIDQVSSLGPDAAIAFGVYQVSGKGQNGAVKTEGYWSEIDVREGDVWKIRLLTVIPKSAPAAVALAVPAIPDNAAPEPKPVRVVIAGPEVKIGSEAKTVAEAKTVPEAKSVAEAKYVAEVKSVAEVKNVSEAKNATETKNVTEAKNISEVKSMSEAKNPSEMKNVIEAKNVSDVKNIPEPKGIPELKGTSDVKNSSDPKKSIVLINIDKEKQEMTVSIDGVQTYDWPVSTGRAGYSTPSGNYTATSMNEIWYSRQWDNAPMPHAIFFMKDGHAIHATLDVKNLGKPASHGCVRISPANATTLFALVKAHGLENTQVVLGGVTPGGEYKVAAPSGAARYSQPAGATYETGDGYYAQQLQARAYYAQPQANGYYAQPQSRAYYTQSQVRAYYAQPQARAYYGQPQGSPAAAGRPVAAPRYAAPQGGYYVMPYAPQ